MEKLVIITLQYMDSENKFYSTQQEIDWELPDNDHDYIIVQAYGEFLTKYTRAGLGDIHLDTELNCAYYLNIFEPYKDYEAVVDEMKQSLISKIQGEADQLLQLADRLRAAGL